MNRIVTQDKIAQSLAVFASKISILSANNEFSWNSLAENIFIPFLNLALDGNFVNENIETFKNSPSIDLTDKNKRISVQVTSSGNFAKVKSTLEKFFDNSFEDDFESLYFLILKDKKGFNISLDQKEQLSNIIQDRIVFDSDKHILDFGKLYTLSTRINLDDLIDINSNLEKELGNLSNELIKNSPAVIVLFDDEIVETAYLIIKGLLERDLRIRYYSDALEKLINDKGLELKYCQRLYDISAKSSATLILSTKEYVEKIEKNQIPNLELETLKNPHLKHILIKFDHNSTFRNFDWISPTIRRGNVNNLNFILNYASNELHKVNKVIEIQDYSDFETIIKLYDTKASFGPVISVRDSKTKIGYKLLSSTNNLMGINTNYLFISKGSLLKPTALQFYRENPSLKPKKDSIILFLPKERGQVRLEERITNAQKAFKAKKTFYLDEFISKHVANDITVQDPNTKFSSTNNFIEPELKAIEGELSDFDQIENWILSEFDPILIITGGGGIGKTTLAREIADRYYQINTNAKIVFIEASNPQVINNLIRLSESKKIDLYDFYSAMDTNSNISRDLFRVTIDNGNLLLIIDGLDEVFSRIPDFDVEFFIKSVSNDFVKQIGVGKVLLTCRTYFWKEQISKENSINHFEIEPFNLDHANQFYTRKFNDSKKIKKAITLLAELDIEKSDGQKFLPFVVDIVGEIIDSENDILVEHEEINLNYLDTREQNDFIVYRLLKREKIKIGIDIVDQIEFMIHLAVFYQGSIKKNEINRLKTTGLKFNIDDKKIESLKSHPLINVGDNQIGFKYDFFELFFKTIYLSEFISIESHEILSKQVIDILLQEGKFGSSLFYEVAKRVHLNWSENEILKISDLIESVNDFDFIDYKEPQIVKHQVKSSLFALALMINQIHYNNQTSTNTILLKLMFGSNNIIKGLSLVNFGILDGNIKFDFSDIRLENSYFDSYDSFWECKFNDETTFVDSTFFNMSDYSRSNSRGIKMSNFVNPRHDTSFENYFHEQMQGAISLRSNIANSLVKYFKIFYTYGAIHNKDNKSTIHAQYHSKYKKNLPIDVIEKVLVQFNLLKIAFDKTRREDVASLSYDFREDIFKFIHEGVESNKMKKAIDLMLQIINN
ncbi:SMEK domain-containing protein [Algibacter sp. AS12]|uniref:SMEK domain-containing protein n=1 Tax=Algibacter sp. AS12 TaxID=3135773 RepID=UPI00398B7C33